MSNTQRMSDEDFEAYETDDACGMLLMESVADKDNTIVELWGWMQAERAKVERVEAHAELNILIASATAHRACTGTEHNPQNGKLHGCCVVCGVQWPCETGKIYLMAQEPKE